MKTVRLNDTAEFRMFYGCESLYRYFADYCLTEGILHLADNYGCYWFINQIIFGQDKLSHHVFQVWKLQRVSPDSDAMRIVVSDGNKNIIHSLDIAFSDFTAGEVEVWYTGKVILLPSEY